MSVLFHRSQDAQRDARVILSTEIRSRCLRAPTKSSCSRSIVRKNNYLTQTGAPVASTDGIRYSMKHLTYARNYSVSQSVRRSIKTNLYLAVIACESEAG